MNELIRLRVSRCTLLKEEKTYIKNFQLKTFESKNAHYKLNAFQ